VLDPERIATWSVDDQLRIWAFEQGRFDLRAALDSPHYFDPCIAPLCDGRVAFSESRGIAVATPQIDGTWRRDELVSPINLAVHSIAALAADRVAFVEGGTHLRVLQLTDTSVSNVADLETGSVTITALAALGSDALAVGSADGRLRIARESGALWQVVEELPVPPGGEIRHLSQSDPFLASGNANDTVMIWSNQDAGQYELLKTLQVPGLTALAINSKGQFAAAAINQQLLIGVAQTSAGPDEPIGTLRHCIALQWEDDDRLLALGHDGQLSRIRLQPAYQEEFLRPGGTAGSEQPVFAVLNGPAGERIACARGSAAIEIDQSYIFAAVHGDVRTLRAAGDILFAGGDALYVFDLRPAVQPSFRRIVVTDEIVAESRLSRFGQVKSARIWRRDPASSWNISAAAGKSLPNDPLLHQHVAVIEPHGQLGEVFTAGGYFFTSDRRVFQIEDPDAPPE
jgi:hypothetical protein